MTKPKAATDFFNLNPIDINVVEDFNPRKNFGDIKELAADIKANGLMQPLIVRDSEEGPGFDLVDGERRYRAIQMLMEQDAWTDLIPCRVMDIDDMTALVATISTGTGVLPLNDLEQADVCGRLKAQGMSQKDIASTFGKSQPWVSQRFKLLGVIPEAVEAYNKGKINGTALLEVASAKGEKKGKKAQQKAQQKHLNKVLGKRSPKTTNGKPRAAGPVKKPGKSAIKGFLAEFDVYDEDNLWTIGQVKTFLLWTIGDVELKDAMDALTGETDGVKVAREKTLASLAPSAPDKPDDPSETDNTEADLA